MRIELNKSDSRWFFDEDLEKALEVKIKCRTIENESIFESRFLYKSKDEAIDAFINKLKEDIKDEENDLKEIIEEMTARIKKQKALLKKLKETKNV